MNKTTKILSAFAAFATLGLAACGGAADPAAVAAPAATLPDLPNLPSIPTTTTSDEDIDIMAMDLTWNPDAVCEPFNSMIEQGMDKDVLIEFGVKKFEEGYGSDLGPAAEAHLIELILAC